MDKESNYAFVQEAIECTNDNEVVLNLRGKDYIYIQEHSKEEDCTDILLNNQSTIHMMVNPQLLKNILKLEQMLQLYTNTGMARVTYEGDLPGVGGLWYYTGGIANVVSQAKTVRENGFEVNYSTRKDENGSHNFTYHIETKEE